MLLGVDECQQWLRMGANRVPPDVELDTDEISGRNEPSRGSRDKFQSEGLGGAPWAKQNGGDPTRGLQDTSKASLENFGIQMTVVGAFLRPKRYDRRRLSPSVAQHNLHRLYDRNTQNGRHIGPMSRLRRSPTPLVAGRCISSSHYFWTIQDLVHGDGKLLRALAMTYVAPYT
ncbi:uncharacterized protein LOC105696992 isoform X2 [Orussus abietinus]|uniref:uncharacterized protein LOC105696992 isoform X2 n=1 Tax=Orussus abietinus TaxID=222816 RepID=UPI00062635F2|nr:uncharacterized protein LOC105696992 isoform X2 [Orussus abietinus]